MNYMNLHPFYGYLTPCSPIAYQIVCITIGLLSFCFSDPDMQKITKNISSCPVCKALVRNPHDFLPFEIEGQTFLKAWSDLYILLFQFGCHHVRISNVINSSLLKHLSRRWSISINQTRSEIIWLNQCKIVSQSHGKATSWGYNQPGRPIQTFAK